ncbi:TetR/AcrR family transcriptional regulator [Actinoplanes sp. URMC 104]|uniref:TetR/AcrR family transcriptional regulator n=1 Tax=Actinoplanes sp. URMC 104 TaxID=3423409 RepID=UPI003F19AAD2
MTGQMRRERRPYDSTGRQAQASLSRARVLEAARRLFIEQGYARTPVSQIAREAGVSVPTVFARFQSKVNLLKLAVDTAIVGDEQEEPLAARPVMRRVREAATFAEVVERLADAFVEVAQRAAPIAAVAYAAADADPEIARLVDTLDAQRLTGASRLAEIVADRLGVTDPAAIRHLRDTIWTLNSFTHWDLLVRQRGWGAAEYRRWMVVALTALCTDAVR